MSLNLNANTSINLSKTYVPLKRCDHTGVTVKYDIELLCTWAMPSILYPQFSMSTLKIWVLKSGILKIVFHLCEHGTKANTGGAKMANNGHTVNSFKAIGRHYTVVSRLVSKNQTNTVKDLTRSGRHHLTSRHENKALRHLIRRMSFAITPDLKRQCLPNRRLSTGRVRNQLKSTRLTLKRVIKCPMVSNQLQRLRCHGVYGSMGWIWRPGIGSICQQSLSSSCNWWTN